MASRPSATASARYPSFSRILIATVWFVGLSSATRIRPRRRRGSAPSCPARRQAGRWDVSAGPTGRQPAPNTRGAASAAKAWSGSRKKPVGPAASPRSPREVIMISCVSANRGSSLILRPSWAPSIPGMCISSKATQKGSRSWTACRNWVSAVGPSTASAKRQPQPCSSVVTSRRFGVVVVHHQYANPPQRAGGRRFLPPLAGGISGRPP